MIDIEQFITYDPVSNVKIYHYDGNIYIPHRYDVPGVELSLIQFEESGAVIMDIDWKACGYAKLENARTSYSGAIVKTNRKNCMKVKTRANKIYICKGDFKNVCNV